jgi:hypothetical protein
VWTRDGCELGTVMHRSDSVRHGLGTGGHVLGLNGVGRAVGAAHVWFVLDYLPFMCCLVACQSNP